MASRAVRAVGMWAAGAKVVVGWEAVAARQAAALLVVEESAVEAWAGADMVVMLAVPEAYLAYLPEHVGVVQVEVVLEEAVEEAVAVLRAVAELEVVVTAAGAAAVAE